MIHHRGADLCQREFVDGFVEYRDGVGVAEAYTGDGDRASLYLEGKVEDPVRGRAAKTRDVNG